MKTSLKCKVLALLVGAGCLAIYTNKSSRSKQNWLNLSQDDDALVEFLKTIIIPPSKSHYNLKMSNLSDFSQNGQSDILNKILGYKKHGTFLEAGAYNGEDLSNSLLFEKEQNWTGLLVEPDPWNFYSLTKKNRKAYSIQACLSPYTKPIMVKFKQSDTMGRIAKENETKGIFTQVNCYPLYSLMKATGLTELDLLSLDIEGNELKILQTLPWKKVNIRAICVEYAHQQDKGNQIKEFLRTKDFQLVKKLGDDFIFLNTKYANKNLPYT